MTIVPEGIAQVGQRETMNSYPWVNNFFDRYNSYE